MLETFWLPSLRRKSFLLNFYTCLLRLNFFSYWLSPVPNFAFYACRYLYIGRYFGTVSKFYVPSTDLTCALEFNSLFNIVGDHYCFIKRRQFFDSKLKLFGTNGRTVVFFLQKKMLDFKKLQHLSIHYS